VPPIISETSSISTLDMEWRGQWMDVDVLADVTRMVEWMTMTMVEMCWLFMED